MHIQTFGEYAGSISIFLSYWVWKRIVCFFLLCAHVIDFLLHSHNLIIFHHRCRWLLLLFFFLCCRRFQMWTGNESHSKNIAVAISLAKIGKRKLTLGRSGYNKRGMCLCVLLANFHAVCSQRTSSISFHSLVDKKCVSSAIFSRLAIERFTAISDIVDLISLMAKCLGITILLFFFLSTDLIFHGIFLCFISPSPCCRYWTVPSHSFVWKLSLSTVMQHKDFATKIRSHWKWAPMWLNCSQM